MGTASMIGVYNKDGSVTASYCHYDGYLSYNGRLLVETYNTTEAANAVANCGYLSGLTNDLDNDLKEAVHKNEEPRIYNSVDTFLKVGDRYAGADYLYLFDGKTWLYTDTYGNRKDRKFKEVEADLVDHDAPKFNQVAV